MTNRLAIALLQTSRKSGIRLTFIDRCPQAEQAYGAFVEARAADWLRAAEEQAGCKLSPEEAKEFSQVAGTRYLVPWARAFEYCGVASPQEQLLALAEEKVRFLEQTHQGLESATFNATIHNVRIEVFALLDATAHMSGWQADGLAQSLGDAREELRQRLAMLESTAQPPLTKRIVDWFACRPVLKDLA